MVEWCETANGVQSNFECVFTTFTNLFLLKFDYFTNQKGRIRIYYHLLYFYSKIRRLCLFTCCSKVKQNHFLLHNTLTRQDLKKKQHNAFRKLSCWNLPLNQSRSLFVKKK